MQHLSNWLRTGRVHEVCGTAARRFAAQATLNGPSLWITDIQRRGALCPQGLAQLMDVSALVIVEGDGDREALWCAEQALRSGACGTVLTELKAPTDLTSSRRLQLAARDGNVRGVCLVPDQPASNAMETRWRALPQPSKPDIADDLPFTVGLPRHAWTCLKNRKGQLPVLEFVQGSAGFIPA